MAWGMAAESSNQPPLNPSSSGTASAPSAGSASCCGSEEAGSLPSEVVLPSDVTVPSDVRVPSDVALVSGSSSGSVSSGSGGRVSAGGAITWSLCSGTSSACTTSRCFDVYSGWQVARVSVATDESIVGITLPYSLGSTMSVLVTE